jgi:ribosomal protein S18 acetylase RimI-like enzyme
MGGSSKCFVAVWRCGRSRSGDLDCSPTGLMVRIAGPEDLPFIKKMLYEAANRAGTEWPPLEQSLNERWNRRFWIDWLREGDLGVIAQDGHRPVGAAWLRRFSGAELSPNDDPEVPVLAIAVDKDYRGQGVGKELMRALIQQAKRQGIRAIDLVTDLFNEPALRLYRANGFEETFRRGDSVRMRSALDP